MAAATSDFHTVCLSDFGTVHSFGRKENNPFGILGIEEGAHLNPLSKDENISVPTQISNLTRIKQISCGYGFTVCLDEEECLWSFGSNDHGQLGTSTRSIAPQKITGIPPVQAISCGSFHMLFICDSNLWSVGGNSHFQLCLEGNPSCPGFPPPQQTKFSQICRISAGHNVSLFQNDMGEIFGCGLNSYGQLGLGHFNSPQIKVCKIPNLPENIIDFCGVFHTLFLDGDGNVFSVGYNTNGALGIGTNSHESTIKKIDNIPPIVAISAIRDSSYLIDDEGYVWSFGNNDNGQLGHGNLNNINIPTKINSLKNIQQLSRAGYGHHFLVKEYEGKIHCMGDNKYDQLSFKNTVNVTSPAPMDPEYFSIWGTPRMWSKTKSARK